MGNFNRDGGGRNKFSNRSGSRDFSGGRRGGFGGSGRRERPEMHRTTCDDCGNRCEVPFRPTGDKPVYCSDCFSGGGDSRSNSRGGGRNFGRDRGRDFSRDRQMHKAVCADCGDNCEVPFRPTGDKPVLCSSCFGGNSPRGGSSSNRSEQSPKGPLYGSEKNDEIIAKLDKILKLLQRTNPVKEITVMKADSKKKKKEAGSMEYTADTPKDKATDKISEAGKKVKKPKKAPAKKKTATKKPATKKKATKKKAPAKKKAATKKK